MSWNAFVAHPDTTPGRRHEEKLRDQLAGVSPEAKQLMAELHAVHFLMIWVGRSPRRRRSASLMQSWRGCRRRRTSRLTWCRRWRPGLSHPGTWVMTRPDTQITWLIRFSSAWKELPEPQRQALVADPWALKEFTGRVDAPSAKCADGGAPPGSPGCLRPDRVRRPQAVDHDPVRGRRRDQ
jgi:hypothetical protein